MKLGLHMPVMDWQGGASSMGATLAQIVETAEDAGFDLIAVADHLWQHPIMGGPIKNQVEAYTTLGFIAARTRRARLLALATAASYRGPGLLAKIVTTLDALSGGRAMLGIGAGDYPEEAQGLGLPYPPLAERFQLLEETLQACLQMWAGAQGDERPFHGRYADACNLRPTPEIPRQLELLRRLCDEAGRDHAAIEKTAPYFFDVGEDGSKVGDLMEKLRWLAGMGIETVFG